MSRQLISPEFKLLNSVCCRRPGDDCTCLQTICGTYILEADITAAAGTFNIKNITTTRVWPISFLVGKCVDNRRYTQSCFYQSSWPHYSDNRWLKAPEIARKSTLSEEYLIAICIRRVNKEPPCSNIIIQWITIYDVKRVMNPQRALLLSCFASFSSLFWFHDTFTVGFNLTALINLVSGSCFSFFLLS